MAPDEIDKYGALRLLSADIKQMIPELGKYSENEILEVLNEFFSALLLKEITISLMYGEPKVLKLAKENIAKGENSKEKALYYNFYAFLSDLRDNSSSKLLKR